MKRLFTILLSAIILFAGCTKLEDTYLANLDNKIEFSTRATTKAIVEGTTMVDNFGVYGYVVPGAYSENGGYLMKNAEFQPNGDAANGKTYYWPKSDNNTNIDFIFTAYAQFDGNVAWANDSLTVTIPTLTQALIDNPDNFDDVLWAQTSVNHHQDGNVGAAHERVNLNFKHALSWLQFNASVVDNTPVKWVKIKAVRFGEYVPASAAVPGTPEIPYQAAVYDTTDVWVNLKRSTNVDGSATKLKGPGESAYTDNAALPAGLVNEIKSYYSINNGTAGDYDLHLGNSVWPSAEVRELRVVKAIPAAYKISAEMLNGDVIEFFDGFKYLKDNGYDIQPRTSGGKPAIWDYILLDAFVNGTAYTVVGFNWGTSYSNPNYTITEVSPEVPYQPGTPDIPAVEEHASEGIYTNGSIVLPTKSLIVETPVAVYSGQKDTLLSYVSSQVDTLLAGANVVLGNALVVPQAVPERITVTFDICIQNATGDEVVITDRRITRVINAGKDADADADYVATWAASNKYIYNFKFDGDKIDFTVSVLDWTTNSSNNYHVWDY